MIITKRVTDSEELKRIFRQRYKIFVERDKDAPAELYTDGILKDKCDENAIHVVCYELSDNSILGFLTVVLKEFNAILPIEVQHEISVEEDTAEIMRLIISDKLNIKFRDFTNLNSDYSWVIAKRNNVIIAFALLIKEEDTLIFKHVGLDYSINRESYAYFNLFFMAINFAIDNGYKSMLCGSTTYDVKLNLGCKLIDRKATIIFNGQQSDNSLDFFEYLNFGENDEK